MFRVPKRSVQRHTPTEGAGATLKPRQSGRWTSIPKATTSVHQPCDKSSRGTILVNAPQKSFISFGSPPRQLLLRQVNNKINNSSCCPNAIGFCLLWAEALRSQEPLEPFSLLKKRLQPKPFSVHPHAEYLSGDPRAFRLHDCWFCRWILLLCRKVLFSEILTKDQERCAGNRKILLKKTMENFLGHSCTFKISCMCVCVCLWCINMHNNQSFKHMETVK